MTTAEPVVPVEGVPEDAKPQGPRSQKGARTRARLIEAAKEVFEEDGFFDARIADISERAGVSYGSFYHYFDSKEQIFRDVAEAADQRLSEPLERVILDPTSTATPRERIREAIRLHLVAYRDEARIMRVVEQVSRYDEQVRAARLESGARYSRQVAGSIRQLQARGLADAALDPEVAAVVLGSMTGRFAEAWFVEGRVDCDLDAGADQVAALFANALQLRDP
jgi:AcrR family transcriptional regulator